MASREESCARGRRVAALTKVQICSEIDKGVLSLLAYALRGQIQGMSAQPG